MRSSLRHVQFVLLGVRIRCLFTLLLVLGCVTGICVPLPAQTSLVAGDLYLYNTDGTVRDVTAQYDAWGYVLDASGTPMMICLADDHTILDCTRSKLIGFVAAPNAAEAAL